MSKALLGQRASGFSAVMQGVSKPGLLSGAASKGSDLPAPWAKARCSHSTSPCRQKRKFMNRKRQGSGRCQEAGPGSAGSLSLGLLLGLSSRTGWSCTRETNLTDSPCAGPGLAYGSVSTGLLVALPSLSEDTRCHQAEVPSWADTQLPWGGVALSKPCHLIFSYSSQPAGLATAALCGPEANWRRP